MSTGTRDWNPRYLAYCRAHGNSDPEEMLARERERWPGGVMCGYLLWIDARWTEWRAEVKWSPREPMIDHGPFDRWLEAKCQ